MRSTVKIIVGFICLAVAAGVFAAEKKTDYYYSIKDGKLFRGQKNIEANLYALEVPALYSGNLSALDVARALSRLSVPGANAVCFDLAGYSADGSTMEADTAAKIDTLLEPVVYRHIGSLCRVIPANAPKNAAFRAKAVAAAAAALKGERRLVYVIDGPDATELVRIFHAAAPDLVVASPAPEADIALVKKAGQAPVGKPAMVLGKVPNAEQRATLHCLLPGKDSSYRAFEKAMRDPYELQRWKPDNSVLTEQERADGWNSLFDGKTLDGWWILGPKKDGFVVRDGCIVWNGSGGRALYTHDRYANFVLRLEWKINKGGNSGLYLRAPRGNRQSKIGMECQIQGDSEDPNVTNQTTGAIYSAVAPKMNACKPEGEWNVEEITCDGPRVKVVLNGKLVQDANLDETDDLRIRLREGFIGLQDHYCQVAFRNIRVKRLP